MGQTITEKIFSEHVGKEVFAGEIVRSPIDMVIGNDITTPISIKAFEDGGFEKLANPEGFAIVLDHFIPAKDIASANQAKISRDTHLAFDELTGDLRRAREVQLRKHLPPELLHTFHVLPARYPYARSVIFAKNKVNL